ncbi:hypothetical protein PTW37_06565 [Arthrobacter agilis]|uniref:hypothetical protein n=1 Tax=Arthrobacter agilis TaxID=37921 RepID=UPI00236534CB|nr:hypothetical protein [Arthrobacter agilis]WDF34557.1 hypothetical protein PTW37_06565 [Arthrobacter agilis]
MAELMPTEIHFGHVTYTVHTDATEINTDEPIGQGQVGASFHQLRAIWVLTEGMTLEQQQNTLLHEVLHCCVNVSGLQVPGKGPDETEEVYISAISTPLHGVLIDNPELHAWLVQGYPQRHMMGMTE